MIHTAEQFFFVSYNMYVFAHGLLLLLWLLLLSLARSNTPRTPHPGPVLTHRVSPCVCFVPHDTKL